MASSFVTRKYVEQGYNILRKGDYVIFIDGSYTLSLVRDELLHTSLGLSTDIFKIIAINVEVPNGIMEIDALSHRNNCIVKNITDNSIHFCSKINIQKLNIPEEELRVILREKAINELL
tara:strand:+ start:134106 stop:134462 length:357 start_codon:yes stop_codon:yes gene_type:complete